MQLTSIKLPGHDLGRSVVGAATAGAQELSVLHEVAEAKVGYLDVVLRVQEEVLWFEVAVDHLVTGEKL